jgi:hypothetical protein
MKNRQNLLRVFAMLRANVGDMATSSSPLPLLQSISLLPSSSGLGEVQHRNRAETLFLLSVYV